MRVRRQHGVRSEKHERYCGYVERRPRRLSATSAALGRRAGQQPHHRVATLLRFHRRWILLRLHDPVHLSGLLRSRPLGLG